MSSSSSSRPLRRRGEVQLTSDWADLPIDVLLSVLQRLELLDVLTGAGQTCRSWRRAARDEPVLWLRIDMRPRSSRRYRVRERRWTAEQAVRRSAGRCETFWGGTAVEGGFLRFLADQASSLKSLRLISSNDISNEAFMEAIEKFPLLDELELSLCGNVFGQRVFQVVAKACPHLKRLRVRPRPSWFYNFIEGGTLKKDNEEALGVAKMYELGSLELLGSELTNVSLSAILDNCPHLDYLDIRRCFNICMDAILEAKCDRIKTLKWLYTTDVDEFSSSWAPRKKVRRRPRSWAVELSKSLNFNASEITILG